MDLLQAILDSIGEQLINITLATVIAIPVILASVFLLIFPNRNKLIIEGFTLDDPALEKEFANMGGSVEAEIYRVLNIHRNHHRAAGDLRIFSHLAPKSSSGEIKVEALLPLESLKIIVRFGFLVFGLWLRPSTLRGSVSRTGDEITLQATIYTRRQAAPQPLEEVVRPIHTPRIRDEMARELALKVIVHQSPDMIIKNWEVLDKFTDALKIWPTDTAVTHFSEEKFEETEAALLAAQEHDLSNPLINYNLALLYYSQFKEKSNENATDLFDRATRTRNIHLKGLATIGLARCHCQKYHRFGQQTQGVLKQARDKARAAVEYIEQAKRAASKADAAHMSFDYARALYCQAFAQHITEKPEDIDRGAEYYRKSIDITKPNVPDFVYNNLGYILTAKVGRFELRGDPADYDIAVHYLYKALEQEPRHKMALANLGNVARLRGDYKEALRRYDEALEIDPNYANGWNEKAWVHLAAGELDEARNAHQKALNLADSADHGNDIKENYARVLYSIGHYEEALRLAHKVQNAEPNKVTINEWLAEVEGETTAK